MESENMRVGSFFSRCPICCNTASGRDGLGHPPLCRRTDSRASSHRALPWDFPTKWSARDIPAARGRARITGDDPVRRRRYRGCVPVTALIACAPRSTSCMTHCSPFFFSALRNSRWLYVWSSSSWPRRINCPRVKTSDANIFFVSWFRPRLGSKPPADNKKRSLHAILFKDLDQAWSRMDSLAAKQDIRPGTVVECKRDELASRGARTRVRDRTDHSQRASLDMTLPATVWLPAEGSCSNPLRCWIVDTITGAESSETGN